MRTCDVVVVGGGPAGSTCARALKRAGADVVVLDRATFPRDKPCAGWITPAVVDALELPLDDYRAGGRTLQELRSFDTSVIGSAPIRTTYDGVVGYAIRRVEFDDWLLRRAGVEVREATPLRSLARGRNCWTVNDEIRCGVVVGAGGHFCPVARAFRRPGARAVVLAREIELPEPQAGWPAPMDVPRLIFSRDMEGYGWIVRKGAFVAIGIGRRRHSAFDAHARQFAAVVAAATGLPGAGDCRRWHGHAYMLADAPHAPIADGVVLIGDAAGLAHPQSGEGIGPAVQSALIAAEVIVTAAPRYTRDDLAPYAAAVGGSRGAGRWRSLVSATLVRTLMSRPWFVRALLDQWFACPPSLSVALPADARPAA